MQQRRVRLGDILDDYCPRERRVTNHVVVAMIEDEVKQTRCSTCDADHEYKEAKVPSPRRKKGTGALADARRRSTYGPVPQPPAAPPLLDDEPDASDLPDVNAADTEAEPPVPLAAADRSSEPADDAEREAMTMARPSLGTSAADSRHAAASRRTGAGTQGARLHDASAGGGLEPNRNGNARAGQRPTTADMAGRGRRRIGPGTDARVGPPRAARQGSGHPGQGPQNSGQRPRQGPGRARGKRERSESARGGRRTAMDRGRRRAAALLDRIAVRVPPAPAASADASSPARGPRRQHRRGRCRRAGLTPSSARSHLSIHVRLRRQARPYRRRRQQALDRLGDRPGDGRAAAPASRSPTRAASKSTSTSCRRGSSMPPLVLPCDVQLRRRHRGGVRPRRSGVRRPRLRRARCGVRAARGAGRRRSSTPARDGFRIALDISAYSLIALARGAVPLMEKRGGGSIADADAIWAATACSRTTT